MAQATERTEKKTALYDLHKAWGGKLVPFAGYALPIQYADGILSEHQHTRTAASLFDVSHMGQATLQASAEDLEKIFPSDLIGMKLGQQRYSFLLNAQGGVIDDLMIIRRGDKVWHLIVNAACKEKDYAHLAEHLGADAKLVPHEELALLAFQGPQAKEIVGAKNAALGRLPFMTATETEIAGIAVFISRSGYTGEDGYEISVAANQAADLAQVLLAEQRAKPVGLGARDTLRLEAGLCLYGNELNETTSPLEAGLGWAMGKRRKADGGFIGAAAVQKEIAAGVRKKRVGLVVEEKRPVRAPSLLLDGAHSVEIGLVTSGAVAATQAAPIAMAYIQTAFAKAGTKIIASQRGKNIPMKIVPLPFRRHNYFTNRS